MLGRKSFYLANFFSVMSYGLIMSEIGPVIGLVREDLAVSSGEIGLLFTILSIGFIVAVILTGYVIDRCSPRLLSIVGQCLLTVGLILFALSTSFRFSLAAYHIVGLGGGVTQVLANTNISSIHTEKRASSISFLHLFFGLGGLIGPLLSVLITQNDFTWRVSYLITGAFSALVVILFIAATFPEKSEKEVSSSMRTLELVKDRYILAIIGMTIIYVGIELGISSWSVLYLETNLDMKKVLASSILSYFWIAMTFGRMLCAVISRRLKAHVFLFILSCLGLVAYGFFLTAEQPLTAGIMLTVVGLSLSGIFPILIALVGNRYPDRIGSGMGLFMASAGIGFMFVPWLIGILADTYSLDWGMRILLVCSAVLVGISIYIVRKTGKGYKAYQE